MVGGESNVVTVMGSGSKDVVQRAHGAKPWVAPERREEKLAKVGDVRWSHAQEAAPGTDLQLQLVGVCARGGRAG